MAGPSNGNARAKRGIGFGFADAHFVSWHVYSLARSALAGSDRRHDLGDVPGDYRNKWSHLRAHRCWHFQSDEVLVADDHKVKLIDDRLWQRNGTTSDGNARRPNQAL